MVLAPCAGAADWSVTPTVQTRASYSDNARLLIASRAQGEWISEVSSGLTITGRGPHLHVDLTYALQKAFYQRQPESTAHSLTAHASMAPLPDWFSIDARSSISRVNVSAFGPQLTDPLLANDNATVVHVNSIEPTLQHRFRGLGSVELGLAHQTVSSAPTGGASTGLHSRSDLTNLHASNDSNLQDWGWDVHLLRQRTSDGDLAQVRQSSASVALRYQLSARLALNASGGYENNDYASTASSAQGRSWSTGLLWVPSPRTSLSASIGRRFFGTTYALDASHRTRASAWHLAYSENITSTHAQYLALTPFNTNVLLQQLWATRIPDALQRQQAIDTFLFLSQLLGPGVGNVNYFSHRYFLQKQWSGSVAASGARTTAVLSVASTADTAQTSSSVDSALLPSGEQTLLDRSSQRSVDAIWTWQESPHTSISAGAGWAQTRSLSSGQLDTNATLRIALARQLQRSVRGAIDVRHVQHTSTSGANYRENAVSASLALQL